MGSVAKSDARRASRAQRTRGVFNCRVCRALDTRRALRCDLATVLLMCLCFCIYLRVCVLECTLFWSAYILVCALMYFCVGLLVLVCVCFVSLMFCVCVVLIVFCMELIVCAPVNFV